MKSIQEFLGHHFNYITEKTQNIVKLNQLWYKVAPENLKDHCEIANYSTDSLVLMTRNSSWATRVRYQTDEILRILHTCEEFRTIRSIHCRLQPEYQEQDTHLSLPERHLPPAAIEAIKEVAANISQNSLKKSLLKLANEPFEE